MPCTEKLTLIMYWRLEVKVQVRGLNSDIKFEELKVNITVIYPLVAGPVHLCAALSLLCAVSSHILLAEYY